MSSEFLFYLNLFSAIYFVALFLSIKLQDVHSKQGNYFSLLILIPVFNLVNNCIVINGSLIDYPWVLLVSSLTAPFFGVLLKAHVDSIIKRSVSFFTPLYFTCYLTCLGFIGVAINLVTKSQEEIELFLNGMQTGDFPIEFLVATIVFYLSQLLFFIDVGITAFKKRKTETNTHLRNITNESIKYVQRLWVSISLIYVFIVVLYAFFTPFLVEYLYLPIGMNGVYLFILFNHRRFTNDFWSDPNEDFLDLEKQKVILQKADKTKYVLLLTAIEEFFHTRKPYLEADFNQRKLEAQIDASVHQISHAINNEYKMNFSDYVNAFRINHSKELLKNFDVKRDTIERISYDSGFNSKASFYRAFKKHTSSTPTTFLALQ